ncbi:MAG TPA: hypothetical protein VKS98_12670, partial [Chthoniobacterales bacterium]|nr:hypothetical protein [Chthoniobacterales bacterium]
MKKGGGGGAKPFAKAITTLWKQQEVGWQDVVVYVFKTNRRINRNSYRAGSARVLNCGRRTAK